MINEKPNNVSLQKLTDFIIQTRNLMFIFFIILFSSLLIFNSIIFILGIIVGIILTILVEIIVLYFFLGLRSSNIIRQEVNKLPEEIKLCDISCEEVCEVAEEENKNDLKIFYRSVVEKSPIKDDHKLENLYIDHNYYCVCKFSPENFINIIKLRTEVGSNFSNNIVILNNIA